MSYFFSAYETTCSKVKDTSLCPIAPGQYFICKDSGDVFYDTEDGVRKHLTDIIDLETDAERISILAPLNKMYFVKETGHFWRHLNGLWVDLSELSSNIGAKPYVKKFAASEWSDGKITIPALEHKQELAEGDVLVRIYMLSNGAYSEQCFAAMDTTVSVNEDKSVILSYDGSPYSGRVILIG